MIEKIIAQQIYHHMLSRGSCLVEEKTIMVEKGLEYYSRTCKLCVISLIYIWICNTYYSFKYFALGNEMAI